MFPASTQIGLVRFVHETTCIEIDVHPGFAYQVDLERCSTPGACLDWAHQIGAKTWGRAVLADFMDMLFTHVPSSFWSGKA